MASIEMYSLTKAQLEDHIDTAKAAVLKALADDGIVDRDVADRWCANHTVLLRGRTIFRTFTDWFNKTREEKDHWRFVVVARTIEAEPTGPTQEYAE